MSDDCDPGFGPSNTNTTYSTVTATTATSAVDLSAATATDGSSVPHAMVATMPVELIFSSSQNGRLLLGGSGVADPTSRGQAVLANTPISVPVGPAQGTYFRFYNEGSATAKLAWTNPNKV